MILFIDIFVSNGQVFIQHSLVQMCRSCGMILYNETCCVDVSLRKIFIFDRIEKCERSRKDGSRPSQFASRRHVG